MAMEDWASTSNFRDTCAQTSHGHAFSNVPSPRLGNSLSCRGLGRSSRLGRGVFCFASTAAYVFFSDATALPAGDIQRRTGHFFSHLARRTGEKHGSSHGRRKRRWQRALSAPCCRFLLGFGFRLGCPLFRPSFRLPQHFAAEDGFGPRP